MHPVERCLLHPPLPGKDGSQTLTLEIVKPILLEDSHSAQLAVVRVLKSTPAADGNANSVPSEGDLVVAKLYDALHYDHEQDDGDPFLCVDYAYSHEAAAYARLKALQGTAIPKYYGSYTLELSVDFRAQARQRLVRLILVEWIDGKSMDKLDPNDFSKLERQDIMKGIVDAESAIYTHDIMHHDLYPRNIMISSTKGCKGVSIIDFGSAFLGRSIYALLPEESAKKKGARWLPGTPISPLLRWHEAHERHEVFIKWIDWNWQAWLDDMYDETRDTITDHMKEVWLPDSRLDRRRLRRATKSTEAISEDH